MDQLNPLEIAILSLLEGPLWSLADLELVLCPEHAREDLASALTRLRTNRLIGELPGRSAGERFFMVTASGMAQRSRQRSEQIQLFLNREEVTANETV